eukprot:c20701_g1_i1.p1 GENE.c20701_g1_i1~~c20701_g1_i1.p1  ORF type:complete len:295 (+),score=108.74 c20701_g1_i1:126-887(+)
MTDFDFARFGRARKWNLEKAEEMIQAWAVWMSTPLPTHPNATPGTLLSLGPDPNEEIYIQYMPHAHFGFGKEGHPIYWEKTGLISARFPQFHKKLSVDDLITRHIRLQEIMGGRFKYSCEKFGKHVEKQIVVFDLEGISYGVQPAALQVFKKCIEIDQSFYPETLQAVFFINIPVIFKALWAVVKPWIDPVTVTKFHLLRSDYIDTLRNYIDDSNIPVEFGGKAERFVWNYPYSEESGASPEQIAANNPRFLK